LGLVCGSISKTDTNLAWESASCFHREAGLFLEKVFLGDGKIMPALAVAERLYINATQSGTLVPYASAA